MLVDINRQATSAAVSLFPSLDVKAKSFAQDIGPRIIGPILRPSTESFSLSLSIEGFSSRRFLQMLHPDDFFLFVVSVVSSILFVVSSLVVIVMVFHSSEIERISSSLPPSRLQTIAPRLWKHLLLYRQSPAALSLSLCFSSMFSSLMKFKIRQTYFEYNHQLYLLAVVEYRQQPNHFEFFKHNSSFSYLLYVYSLWVFDDSTPKEVVFLRNSRLVLFGVHVNRTTRNQQLYTYRLVSFSLFF